MEPTLVTPPAPWQPQGNWIQRGTRALLCEHRLPTRLAAIVQRLLAAVGSRTRILCAGGCRVRVRRLAADEHYVREVLLERAYNPPGFEIGPTATVIDVGGNVGAFALLAASQARQGCVISVEPVESNFRLLERNLADNGFQHATAVRAAIVGSDAKQTTIYLSPLGSGHHTLLPALADGATGSEQVEAIRLDQLLARFELPCCDFLKIDAEGAEFDIFQNMTPALAARIDRLAVEYHTRSERSKRDEAARLLLRLEELGFQIAHYTDILGTTRGMIFARQLRFG